MALQRTFLKAQPVSVDAGRAFLALLDGQTGGSYSRVTATANDNGQVIGLTVQDGQVMAHPIAVGSAVVTFSAWDNGAQMTGTATVTVTSVGGRLQAAWSSGTATIH